MSNFVLLSKNVLFATSINNRSNRSYSALVSKLYRAEYLRTDSELLT